MVPRQRKVALLIGENHRVTRICSNTNHLSISKRLLALRFIANGFPKHIIDRYLMAPVRNNIQKTEPITYVRLPYINDHLCQRINNLTHR